MYYTTYDKGVGADRWITAGYRDAFEELGHEFLTTESEQYDLVSRISEAKPDMFIGQAGDFSQYPRTLCEVLQRLHAEGTAIFMFVDEYFKKHLRFLQNLERGKVVDIYFGYHARESMREFETRVQRSYHLVPLAANHLLHFPVSPDPQYAADISFVGNRLPTKETAFRRFLFPLFKKYTVRVYGPNWTVKDKFFRALSGAGRKVRFFRLADWANERRVTVPPEDERKVYSSSRICINLHEYGPDGEPTHFSNEREFKVPACGGFQISDYVRGIENFFVPDKEIVLARTADEWFHKIDFYMRHEDMRKIIQENGTKRALSEHTYLNRARQFLWLLKQRRGASKH